jgi:3',5'-cyclic AMP phosphodiesterase CpdA
MRLAHCSDLHLLSLAGARVLDFANKRWIGGLNLLTSRSRHHHTEAFEDMVVDFPGAGIDHVLCTGDVSNLGLAQEYRFARERFDQIALGPRDVTILPGNHDSYVAEGLKHFAEVFPDYFAGDPDWAWPADAADPVASPWPIVRMRGPVAIIGVSTSLQTPWFTAWGRIGAPQLARLEQVLTDPRLADAIRVVAIHHPPAGKRAQSRIRGLRDHAAFAEVLGRAGAELVVHGHEHENLEEEIAGPAGAIPVLGIVSGTYEAGRPARTARYRVFEIEPGPAGGRAGMTISHHLRIWHRDRRAFALDDATAQEVADRAAAPVGFSTQSDS